MSRYIDADKLKSEFDFEHIDMNKTAAFVHHCNILEIIDKQPTADVVEVVRCKDCKWWKPFNDRMGQCGYDMTHKDFYCQRGIKP